MTEPMFNWEGTEVIYLSPEEWEQLMNMLDEPPKDLPRLRAALDNDPFID